METTCLFLLGFFFVCLFFVRFFFVRYFFYSFFKIFLFIIIIIFFFFFMLEFAIATLLSSVKLEMLRVLKGCIQAVLLHQQQHE